MQISTQSFSFLDNERIRAQVSKDRLLINRICSRDLVYIHSNGVLNDFESFRDLICDSDLSYTCITPLEQNVLIETTEVLLGNGKYRVVFDFGGDSCEIYIAGISLWKRSEDAWKFERWQATKLA